MDALGKVACPPSTATITHFRPSGIKALQAQSRAGTYDPDRTGGPSSGL